MSGNGLVDAGHRGARTARPGEADAGAAASAASPSPSRSRSRSRDEIVVTTIDAPLAKPLFDDLAREYSTRYHDFTFKTDDEAPDEFELYPPILFTPPGGLFLLIVRDGEPIAGGAFMPLDERSVEVKRVWTSSAHRRQGLSRRVMAALEAEAASRGFERVYLTTGPRQPEAKNLYLAIGFTPLFDVEADPETVVHLAFEKAIEPTGPRHVPTTPDEIAHAEAQRAAATSAARFHAPPPRRLDD